MRDELNADHLHANLFPTRPIERGQGTTHQYIARALAAAYNAGVENAVRAAKPHLSKRHFGATHHDDACECERCFPAIVAIRALKKETTSE